jgi:cytoplasmic iron level regulating protein YaaA (DUF328/UPF0246 family)
VLILLPPSETKRPGGSGVPLLIDDLAFAGLAPQREAAVGALEELAKDPGEMARVLKLSARQIGEVDVNAGVRSSPTMPAIDRFTGVLFDALDASSLGENVAIQTALLGPVGSLDPIPAFRLSAGQRLPGLAPLKRHWAEATTAELGVRGPVLDMRSEAYRALGPVPEDVEQAYVRVVNGEGRALNHLNKQTKGVFARALALAEASFGSLEELVEWARTVGFVVSAERGEIVLEEASSVPEAKIFAIGPVGR